MSKHSPNLEKLSEQLHLLVTKYPNLHLPQDVRRYEVLASASEPLKTELEEAFNRLEGFPPPPSRVSGQSLSIRFLTDRRHRPPSLLQM
jgi:hypothetical protein